MKFMNRIRDYIYDGRSPRPSTCANRQYPHRPDDNQGIERIGRPMADVQSSIENAANLEVSRLEAAFPTGYHCRGAPMLGFLVR